MEIKALRLLPPELYELIKSPAGKSSSPIVNPTLALFGVAEGNRDDAIFRYACSCRARNMTEEECLRLVLSAADACSPPFPKGEAAAKVKQAYKYPSGTTQKTRQPDFWPDLISAKELLQMRPDPTLWVWEDCLPVGGCSILVAKPKVGKTHFAINLALAVCRGIPFLNRGITSSPVAYLSLDASLAEMKQVLDQFKLKDSDTLFLHAGRAPKDAIGWIIERIEKYCVKLIIIDTLQKLFHFQNVNDYSEVTNAMEPLLEAAREQKCHFICTHHAKKDTGDDLDSAVGSTAIRGMAYSYLHMKRLLNSTQRIFRTDQRGGRNFEEIAISDPVSGWIEKIGTREDAEINEAKPRVLEFLRDQEESATEKQIRANIPLMGIIVSKALRALLKSNEINRTGTGRRGNAFRYAMAGRLFESEENIL